MDKKNISENNKLNKIFEKLNSDGKKSLLLYVQYLIKNPENIKRDTVIIQIPQDNFGTQPD